MCNPESFLTIVFSPSVGLDVLTASVDPLQQPAVVDRP
jgi:hypothetical protein